MYISKMIIKNFRSINNLEINFNQDLNIIIGQNNSGKSNLIRALRIVFDKNYKKYLNVNDFYKYIPLDDLHKSSPKISISVIIEQSEDEDIYSDDIITVSNWLIKLEEPYVAKLTYEFFLPLKYEENYINRVSSVESIEEIWEIIDEEYIRFYISKIWCGEPKNKNIVDNESLQKFDFQFLSALRDVEHDMKSGNNSELKKIIEFFMDYDIKSGKINDNNKFENIKTRKNNFKKNSENLIKDLQNRMNEGKKIILQYANQVGALFGDTKIDFEGTINDIDLYSHLKLIVKNNNFNIPITNNGLGYNNLIYTSLLLSKMQIDCNGDYLGSNAKVYPILAIEEPEAHLHPSMQYKFLEFIKDNLKQKKVRQVFLTTHSTHIVASIPLDYLICLFKENNKVNVAYPALALIDNKDKCEQNNENKCNKLNVSKSKSYVERFLDATKSDMLFADKVIFVEGIAEQILIPIFAKYIGYKLEDKHVTIINVGGRYFEHFLKLFDCKKNYTIKKKIACITDIDPECKEKNNIKSRYRGCFPYEFGLEHDNYEYKQNDILINEFKEHPNIKVFTQDSKFGKTFEYNLIFDNPTCKLLLNESISNYSIISKLMDLYSANKSLEEMINVCNLDDAIIHAIKKVVWDTDDKKKAIIATKYLLSIKKGENALELAYSLKNNIEKIKTNKKEYVPINIPIYIQNAIKWVWN